MSVGLRLRILRYSLYVITLLILAGAIFNIALGVLFGYFLLGFSFILSALIIWSHRQPHKLNIIAPTFAFLFNGLIILGSTMLNGMDGSAPVVFLIWTVLCISILPSNWSFFVIGLACVEQIGLRILHDVYPQIILPYNNYNEELNDKVFIYVLGGIAIGLIFRSYLLKNEKEQLELSQSKEKLEKSTAQLMESNERLEEFAYVSSHDLKSPIRRTKTLLEFTLEDYEEELPSEVISNLNKAQSSLKKMYDLVDDLLMYSRADQIEFSYQIVNLNELLEEFVQSYDGDVNDKIVINDLPTVRIDKVRIKEVIYNLISNGLKYNQSNQKHIEVGYSEFDQSLWFKDNGIGIARGDQDKIFKVFHRLHADSNEYEGTGTGLAIVKRILDRHNIDIQIESEIGNGTTFKLNLSNCLVG